MYVNPKHLLFGVILICSVILGELEYFRNNKDFSSIFPKILDAI